MTPVGTLYRRAVKRVIRRSTAYRSTHSERAEALLREACRLANSLALLDRWAAQ